MCFAPTSELIIDSQNCIGKEKPRFGYNNDRRDGALAICCIHCQTLHSLVSGEGLSKKHLPTKILIKERWTSQALLYFREYRVFLICSFNIIWWCNGNHDPVVLDGFNSISKLLEILRTVTWKKKQYSLNPVWQSNKLENKKVCRLDHGFAYLVDSISSRLCWRSSSVMPSKYLIRLKKKPSCMFSTAT